MKVEWYGHSCFKITEGRYSIVLDPYEDHSVPGYGPLDLTANEVICTHKHLDHYGLNTVKVPLVLLQNPFEISKINTYHDKEKGALRGNNQIIILKTNEYKIAHLGDLGCELTKDQIKKLQGLDLLLIPVGGFFTIGAKEAYELVSLLQPRIVIPMHYKDTHHGYPELSSVDPFTSYFDKVTYLKSNEFELANQEGVLVFKGFNEE